MSKIKENKFDYKSLDINREINEEIGKLKNRINYSHISKNNNNNNKNKNNTQQDKNKKNKSGKKNSNSSLEGLKEQKNQGGARKNSNNHYRYQYSVNSTVNDNIKSSNSKEGINIIRAKVIKKKNFDKVERVVIDLVNRYDVDTYKTESVSNSNVYENEKFDKKSTEYYENLNNKDNNIYNNSNSISNDITLAINMIESRWKNKCTSINVLNIPILSDEITQKKKEIENILNRWNNNTGITKDKLSIFKDDNSNIINKWKKNTKISKELNFDFPVDELKIKEKEINKNTNRWIKNNQKINGENLSFLVDILEKNKKEMEKIKKKWNNNSQMIQNDNISFIVDELQNKAKEIENSKMRWNNNCQTIKGESLSFIVDNEKIKKKEFESIVSRWNNNIEKENIFSIATKKDKDSFNYPKKKYIDNLLKNIYISENNNNNYIVLNHENNLINNNLNKINYKIIKPNNKNELELALYNIYNENNNSNNEKSDDVNNKSNNNNNSNTDITSTKETFINPLFVLNDEQLTQLYNEFNIKIGNKNAQTGTDLAVAKEIEIDLGIIDPYSHSEKNNCSFHVEKTNDVKVDGNTKTGEDFEQNTPLSMLNDKFYVFAVSRNNKYSILSPQSKVNYIYNNINLRTKNKLSVNHFSLRIEKIDKGDSYRSIELNETSDKK